MRRITITPAAAAAKSTISRNDTIATYAAAGREREQEGVLLIPSMMAFRPTWRHRQAR